jgi:glycosyltransferase involved in cell wall biosynthesis
MEKDKLIKRVALFAYWGWLSVSPSLVSAINILSENGYLVDVLYLYDDIFGYFESDLDNVRSIPVKPNKIKYIHRLHFFQACYNITRLYAYDFLIGVDQEGIIAAGILAKIRKIPYGYYSLEILAKEDIHKRKGFKKIFWNMLKILESHFSRKAFATIVQDNYRANILIKDNLLDESKIFIVPNSYYFTDNNINNKNYDLGIPVDKKIIIYTGSIVQEVAIKEIIDQVKLWPEDTVLVLHAPHRTPYLEEVEQIINQNNLRDKIIISIKRLTFDELCILIRQAHIGISFYESVDKNTELACSGKVSFYLSQGIPMIINNISPQSMELVSKYRCGVCVNSSEEVGKAIQIILNNYSDYSENAKIAFKHELDFKKYFNKVLEYIEAYH